MVRSFLVAALSALALSLGSATGCGLVDPDITHFDLALPDKTFTVDADSWMLQGADQLVAQTCDPANDPCVAAAEAACAEDTCVADCNDTTRTCDLTLFISLYTAVDLLNEKPELQTIDDEPVIDVTIDDITYTVTENTLNVDTPELKVYVAPTTVMRAGDPMAREIGSVPPIPAGQTVGEMRVVLSPQGRSLLADFMGEFKTPFNIIVGSNLLVTQGDPVPQGRLVVRVAVSAHAGV